MIPANELKKGNLFLCQLEEGKPEDICKVIWLTADGIVNQHDGVCPYSASSTIPLTPKWLERCGFEYHMPYYIFKSFIVSENRIRDGSGKYDGFHMTVRIEDRMVPMVIRYLHHLQNIYFALTGKELKIEL